MAQFKSFIVAQIIRTAGREINGQGGYGAVSGLVQFGVAATVLGTVAEFMRDVAKNENPLEKFRSHPAQYLARGSTRGGATGPLGDFVFGEFSRHGQRFTGYVAGPTGSIIDDLLSIKSQVVDGKPVMPSLLNAARNNLPLQNVWFGKAAFDHFFWSELMDYAQPGYSARVKRRQRQDGVKPIIGN